MSNQEQKIRSQQILRKVIKDIESVMRLLDTEDAVSIIRLRSAVKDVKIAEGELR